MDDAAAEACQGRCIPPHVSAAVRWREGRDQRDDGALQRRDILGRSALAFPVGHSLRPLVGRLPHHAGPFRRPARGGRGSIALMLLGPRCRGAPLRVVYYPRDGEARHRCRACRGGAQLVPGRCEAGCRVITVSSGPPERGVYCFFVLRCRSQRASAPNGTMSTRAYTCIRLPPPPDQLRLPPRTRGGEGKTRAKPPNTCFRHDPTAPCPHASPLSRSSRRSRAASPKW